LVNDIIHIILLICGLFVVGDFINMISGYIGAGNAFADGKSLRGSVKGLPGNAAKKFGAPAVKYGAAFAGGFARAKMARETVLRDGGTADQADAAGNAAWKAVLKERLVTDTLSSFVAKATGDTMTNIKKQWLTEEYKGRDDAEDILHGEYGWIDTQNKFNRGITQSSKALGAIKSSLREEFWNDRKGQMDQAALNALGISSVKGDKAEAALKLIDNATAHIEKSNNARIALNSYYGNHDTAINSVISSSKIKDRTAIDRAISTGSELNINALSQQLKTMLNNDVGLQTIMNDYIARMSALRHAEDELKTFNATHLDAIEGNNTLNTLMEAELMRIRQESHKEYGFSVDPGAVQTLIDASRDLAASIGSLADRQSIIDIGKEVDNQKKIGK
jgi:hypothetical protein